MSGGPRRRGGRTNGDEEQDDTRNVEDVGGRLGVVIGAQSLCFAEKLWRELLAWLHPSEHL